MALDPDVCRKCETPGDDVGVGHSKQYECDVIKYECPNCGEEWEELDP